MKTKYLFGAAAALMFAACSQDELVSVKQDAITYSVTAATQTRAADSYCNSTLPAGFKVWAKTGDGELYINGDRIANRNGVWTDEDGTRYWPDGKTLDFYAEVNGNNEFRFNDGAPTFENFTVYDKVEDQLDLIYSVHKNQGKPTDGKVTLNFRHALSQVCFRARNNMKNMQVEIKGVTVGHLAKTGTFAFPTESTDNNYEHHDDVADNTTTLNGGVWTIAADAQYSNKYSVTPLGGSVVLKADSKETQNLTCPAQGHENGFVQVLTLLPQTVQAWNPEEKGSDFNGAYFLVDVVLSNIVKNDEGADVATVVYDGQAAIPVNVAWKQGYRYIYTFIFDEGGDGGWTPDPNDPKPVLTSVKYDVTVDDFIPVDEDKKMDTGKEEEEPTETTYALTFNANGGHFGDLPHGTGFTPDSTLTATSKEASYEFKVFETKYSLGASYKEFGYDLIGWAWAEDATTPDFVAGNKVILTKANPAKTLYAVWKEHKTTFKLIFDGNAEGVTGVPAALEFESADHEYEFTVPEAKEISNGGYVFKGWADVKKVDSLDDIKYKAGSKISVNEDAPVKTIYAVWGTPSEVIVPPPATGEDW